jgi:glycerol-3-phosphate dehydrogenase
MKDVEYCYGGLRPIVEEETDVKIDVYDKSRKYEIYDHARDHLEDFFTVVGGKYTTSRALAEKLVDKIFEKLHRPSPPCITHQTPVLGGHIKNWEAFVVEAKLRHRDLPEITLMNMLHTYGSAYEDILSRIREDHSLGEPIAANSATLKSQVVQAVENEMAVELEDVVMRRTDLPLLCCMEKNEIHVCAQLMGGRLGWNKEKIAAQTEKVWKQLSSKGIKYPRK